jgi:hypothetical protein
MAFCLKGFQYIRVFPHSRRESVSETRQAGLTPFPTPCLAATTRLTKDPDWQPCAQGITNQKFDVNINNAFSIFIPILQQQPKQTPPHDVAPHQSTCNLYPALQKHRRSPLPLFASRTARQRPILHCSIDASCWDTVTIGTGYHGAGMCVIIPVLGH